MFKAASTKLQIAMCVLTVLARLPAAALAAEDKKPDPIGEFNQRRVVLQELQKQLEPLLRRYTHGHDPETLRQVMAIQSQMTAVKAELATLAIQAGKPELVEPFVEAKQNNEGSPNESSVERRTAVIKDAPEDQVAWTREELVKRERRLAELNAQMAKLERDRSLPPLPHAEVKVFTLVKSPVAEAARTIESLFGAQTLRVATDERTNSLIVLGAPDSLSAVEALLAQIDQQNTPKYSDVDVSEAKATMKPSRSLLLRIFWLADGLSKDETQNAADFLPKSVLEAVARLGLNNPSLVTQTVSSIALGSEGPVDYSFEAPAVVFNQPANLHCAGQLHPAASERVGLGMQLMVTGRGGGTMCQLSGSLSMPLEHYMVLGTANSVMAEPSIAPPTVTETTTVDQNGRPATTSLPPAGEAKYNTSHFAFVVQVIEAESFAPEAPSETKEAQPKAAKK